MVKYDRYALFVFTFCEANVEDCLLASSLAVEAIISVMYVSFSVASVAIVLSPSA